MTDRLPSVDSDAGPRELLPVKPHQIDSTGNAFDPDSCSHAYGYNGSGQLTTDTATNGSDVWVKTFSYTTGNLTGETKWVKS